MSAITFARFASLGVYLYAQDAWQTADVSVNVLLFSVVNCSDSPCFPGVACVRWKGATCGACPSQHTGNGYICVNTKVRYGFMT